MEINLLDRMLSAYLAGQTHLTVTLQNKIRIAGKIRAFDSYIILMEGQKSELVYRHAVSSISPNVPEEQKRPPAPFKPAPAKTAPRPVKISTHRPQPRAARPAPALSASAGEAGLNNSMKDGLLRWMQEQKAAK